MADDGVMIGKPAFAGSRRLQMPGGGDSIGEGEFLRPIESCDATAFQMRSIKLLSCVPQALEKLAGLENFNPEKIEFSEGVRKIRAYPDAFIGIRSLDFPGSLTALGEGALGGWKVGRTCF
jgi:hypothetical protein